MERSVSDEDETDMEENGCLVAKMGDKMDDETVRDFEIPDLTDNHDDVPHDTETDTETDTAPINVNGNGD